MDDDVKITLPEAIQKLEALGWRKELIAPAILELKGLLSQNNPVPKFDKSYGRDKRNYQKPN